MNTELMNLQPADVFGHFRAIAAIPHGSGNEAAISAYLFGLYDGREGYSVVQDAAKNIIIRKAATPGYENAPIVMLQAHMDMVCEKTAESQHDFTKDPLQLRVIDGHLYATDTTLGADNGIGLCMALAVLDDAELAHPALEVVITTDEEAGMTGARELDHSALTAQMMINLDDEEEGCFRVGCAGGGRYIYEVPLLQKANTAAKAVRLTVSGLQGGHSGADIHLERANALKLLGRVLYDLRGKVEIAELSGGGLANTIARQAEALLVADELDAVYAAVERWQKIFANEYATTDGGVTLSLIEEPAPVLIYASTTANALLYLINVVPHGVLKRDNSIDLVVTSDNLASVKQVGDMLEVYCMFRSSIDSQCTDDVLPRLKQIGELLGIGGVGGDSYPGWQYRPDSKIREICREAYIKRCGSEPKIAAIHAGLECGLFLQQNPQLDAIAFGPTLYGVHTPEEHADIGSVERVYALLKDILSSIK